MIIDKVTLIITEQLGEFIIVPTSNLSDDLGADSLDLVELVMALEEEFKVTIPDSEAEKIKTVQDIVDYLEKSGVKN